MFDYRVEKCDARCDFFVAIPDTDRPGSGVQLQSGDVKQFVTGFAKRYVTEKLAAHLQGEGWTFLRGFCYGPDNFGMVVVFRREQPRKRRGASKK